MSRFSLVGWPPPRTASPPTADRPHVPHLPRWPVARACRLSPPTSRASFPLPVRAGASALLDNNPEGDFAGYRDFYARFITPPAFAKAAMDLARNGFCMLVWRLGRSCKVIPGLYFGDLVYKIEFEGPNMQARWSCSKQEDYMVKATTDCTVGQPLSLDHTKAQISRPDVPRSSVRLCRSVLGSLDAQLYIKLQMC